MKNRRLKIKPHSDIELNFDREKINAYYTIPDHINEKTGLFFLLNDFDESGEKEIIKNEVRTFVTERFNCITVSVDYFGCFRGERIEFTDAFFYNINRIYGLNLDKVFLTDVNSDKEIYAFIGNLILKRKVTSLDIRCQPIIKTGKREYQSWGFLPALDNLTVSGRLIKEYDINKNRIYVYGKNYAGYIALLMGKLAPKTFSAIIEREGYTKTELRHVVGGEVMEPDTEIRLNIQGYEHDFTIACAANNPWTIEDEDSPYYFSDSHRKIRNLLIEKHHLPSKTKYFCYHSEDNGYSSLEDKKKLVELLKQTNPVEFHKANLDKPFTKMSDMEFLEEFLKTHDFSEIQSFDPETDFDQESQYCFDCGVKDYVFDYSKERTLSVRIEEKK